MLRLIAANLRYRLTPLAIAVGVALAVAVAANMVLPALGLGPSPEDDFKLPFLFPVFALLAVLAAEIGCFARDVREQRVVGHSVLPTTRLEVGVAVVMTPTLVILLGLALASALMLVIHMVLGLSLVGWRFLFLVFFAGEFLVVAQFPVLIAELRPVLARDLWARTVFLALLITVVAALLLRVAAPYVRVHLAMQGWLVSALSLNPESLTSSVVLHGLGWVMAGVSLMLFVRRRSVLE